jgi:glucosamine 6-phosphate synthetase-like amidotransferase/phosphosugar isomerase protein
MLQSPQLGMLAQEVEAVLPLLVGKDSEGYSTVAYSRLTPVLVEAVKELDAQNSELAARLSAAESRLQQLEAAVQSLLLAASTAAAVNS